MKGLITFFVRNPIWSNVLIILIFIFGLTGSGLKIGGVQLPGIKKSLFPELESRVIQVQVVYPGASPEEMEEGVTLKIEEALTGEEGIEQTTSVSTENAATILVEIKKGYDITKKLTDVKNAVDKINSFPVDAEKPIVFLLEQPGSAIDLVLEGDVPLRELKTIAERVEADFLNSGFISQIIITGFPELEISIDVEETTLKRYKLTFDDIAAAVSLNNRDISGGLIRSDEEEIIIRSNAKRFNPDEIGNIVLRSNIDGSIIKVNDVATVEERFSETPNKTVYDGKNAVGITVKKLIEEDIIEITDHVKEYVKEFNSKHDNINLTIQKDHSELLKQRFDLLVRNGSIGLVFVLIALGFFLSLRLSFWVAFSIPLSFLGMFFCANLIGITLNMISLFGMILVIGILVDDGIVVAENVFAHYEKGKTRFQAAVDGTAEVIKPVFASVTTTLLAFSLIFFLEGHISEMIFEMAFVVIACLAFSLIDALIILPSHLAYSGGLSRKEPGKLRRVMNKTLDYLRDGLYDRLLKICIENKYITIAVTWFLVFTMVGLLSGGFITRVLFPPIERDDVSVYLVLPPGTRENITESILVDIEDKIWEVNEILSNNLIDSDTTKTKIILNIKRDIGSAQSEKGSNTGTLSISLVNSETRKELDAGTKSLSSFKIADLIRDKVGIIPEAEKLIVSTRQIFGKPLKLSLNSKNLDDLLAVRDLLIKRLHDFPQLTNLTDNYVVGRREIRLELTPEAYYLGLTHNDIARQIRQGFFGQEIQRLQKGDDEVKIWTRYQAEDRKNIGQLEDMKIRTPKGQEFPLKQLATYKIKRGLVSINHRNGAREITVEADVKDPNEPVPALLDKIENDVLPDILAAYPDVRYIFQGQQEESSKMSGSVAKAGPIILVLIILLIALVFNSFSQSFMILHLVIIGIAAAIAGHGIEGKPISILSMFGVIALSGVIVNDAVVFLDKFNRLLKEGHLIKQAVYMAGKARFRAIMLTSITTVAGLYPIILEKSMQAQFLQPMAIAVAYGVLFGTFFIITYFPAFILVVNSIRRVIWWLFKGYWPTPEEVEPVLIKQKKLAEGEKI